MSEVNLEIGDTFTQYVKMYPDKFDSYPYSLISSSNCVAVDGKSVAAVSQGQSEITVKATYDDNDFTDSFDAVVANLGYTLTSSRTITGIALARIPTILEVGEEFSAQAYLLNDVSANTPKKYAYEDDNLVYFTSSDDSKLQVKNGVLRGIAAGNVTVTAHDCNSNISRSFDVSVVPEESLTYTPQEVYYVNSIDTTDEETTTTDIIDALEYAAENNYKKIVFPKDDYFVSPEYGTFSIPSNTIVDFSRSTMQIVASSMSTTGYTMFLFDDTEMSSLENLTLYGERYLIEGFGAYGCNSVIFSGKCHKSGLKNCEVSNSPGFNIGFGSKNRKVVGCGLSYIESGGIDQNGDDISASYTFRNSNYINISTIGEKFGFGNMQGYQGYLYLSARIYDIYFYDANKEFISALNNCVQYYMYPKPQNAVYARITFCQDSAPISGDPDYHAIAHIYSYDHSDKCYFKHCTFKNNVATAISPNSFGRSTLIEDCTFVDNGTRDPASHIDWEDGRNHNKGHILRNCHFKGGGQIAVLGADGLVVHNNVFEKCSFSIGSEAQNSRIWLNQFNKATASIATKTDMVFSQNYGYRGATLTITNPSNVSYSVRAESNDFAT